MRTIRLSIIMLAAASVSCLAQQWEFGGTAGVGFLPGVPVTGAQGSATTGFKPGVALGGFVGQNLYHRFSGELHYAFMKRDLMLKSGGTEATFSGQGHVVHYDVVFHTSRSESRTQVYVAAGGGMKVFRGTGKEAAYQPLSQYGYFTRTQSVKPMGTAAVGVKFGLAPHLSLRAEFRDYITAFPQEIIAPAPGAKFGSLLHDLVPMVVISYQY